MTRDPMIHDISSLPSIMDSRGATWRKSVAMLLLAFTFVACGGAAVETNRPAATPSPAATMAGVASAVPVETDPACPTPQDPAVLLLTPGDVGSGFSAGITTDPTERDSTARKTALADRGFASAQRVRFSSTTNETSVASSAWVFACEQGARAEFDEVANVTNNCIDDSTPATVAIGETIGDASTAWFCPELPFQTSTARADFTVQILVGSVVLRVNYAGDDASSAARQQYAVGLAKGLAARAGG